MPSYLGEGIPPAPRRPEPRALSPNRGRPATEEARNTANKIALHFGVLTRDLAKLRGLCQDDLQITRACYEALKSALAAQEAFITGVKL